ncbi:MAG: hypothetical protein U0166_26580 [Acidobacteriota bacterium]
MIDATAIRAIAKVNFFAYATLKYGVVHAAADLERDGYDEIVTAPGPGSSFGPQVRGFNVDGGAVSAMKINFFAFTGVSYGANVAGGDVDADDFADPGREGAGLDGKLRLGRARLRLRRRGDRRRARPLVRRLPARPPLRRARGSGQHLPQVRRRDPRRRRLRSPPTA